MGVDELALRGVLGQVAQEGARFGHRPAFDAAGVAGEIERQPAGRGMAAHQALAHRRPFLALGVGEIGEAQDAARKDLAVQADEVVHLALGLLVERIVGRAHVGEFGVAAGRRDVARRQQRILGRHRLERAVGMPELVAQPEQAAAVVARQHLVVLVEVGDVVQVHAHAPVLAGGDVAGGLLERAQAAAEDELLVVVDLLVVEHQHAEAVHAGMDGRDLVLRQRTREVEARHVTGEEGPVHGIDGLDVDGHGRAA